MAELTLEQQDAAPEPTIFEEPYRVIDFELCTPTIAQLCLRPVAAALDYQPGQYVLLEDRHHDVPPRSYSMANAPRPGGSISLLVTRVPDGHTSSWIHDRLRVGDAVALSGPYGTFVDDPVARSPALFLAAGSGLAPIRSLIEAALERGTRSSVALIFSARTEADVIDCARFERLQASEDHFRFVRTLTRASGTPPHGRIPVLLPELYDGLAGYDVFVAGAAGFVAACAAASEALGAQHDRIHTEAFSSA